MTKPVAGEMTREGLVVHVTERYVVTVAPMIYNHRIVLTEHEQWPRINAAGWCYDSLLDAHLAALVYDPETDREPAGYKKIAYDLRYPLIGCERCSRQAYDGPPDCGEKWCPASSF